jgi:putative endonuclease
MKHYVYILKSINFKRHYIGYTVDIKKRVKEHNIGNTKSTRPFKPWKLIYYEEFNDKSEAYKREWHLKHPKGYKEKLQITERYGRVA